MKTYNSNVEFNDYRDKVVAEFLQTAEYKGNPNYDLEANLLNESLNKGISYPCFYSISPACVIDQIRERQYRIEQAISQLNKQNNMLIDLVHQLTR